MNQKLIIGGIAVAILLSLVAVLTPGPSGKNGKDGSSLGGVSPDFGTQYLQWGGVYDFRVGIAINSATSSAICAIQNPAVSTTSIKSLGAQITANSSGAANVLTIATSTGRFATSSAMTLVLDAPIASNAQASIQWSGISTTSPGVTGRVLAKNGGALTTGIDPYVLGPSEWLIFKIATTTPGTFSSFMQGTCSAVLQRL